MTTPQEARAIADMLQTDIPIGAVEAFRDLADQVEALTAELNNIASANLKTWDKDYNTAADFMAWAQSRARAAIAKGTACKGFEIEPGVFSGCNQSAGDCPVCGK